MRSPLKNALMLAVMALLGISTLSGAQIGGSRSAQRNNNNPEDIGLAGPPPIAAGVAALAIEHAAELGLTDSQNIALATIRQSQDSANAPRLKVLDSLRPTRRPAGGVNDLSNEQRQEIDERRAAITPVLEAVRETNAEARVKVMALLTPDQQKRAAGWEEDARKKADEDFKRSARSGFGGGADRMRGRRPPEE
ncbi:MAG: Spy/CpxP family protein refolding chaperone [bacterium]